MAKRLPEGISLRHAPPVLAGPVGAVAARTPLAKAGLEPIGLHECRHTFASLMIAAGDNAKALSTSSATPP
jgi:integrase